MKVEELSQTITSSIDTRRSAAPERQGSFTRTPALGQTERTLATKARPPRPRVSMRRDSSGSIRRSVGLPRNLSLQSRSNASAPALSRPNSSTQSILSQRNSSAPLLNQTLLTSPIDENAESHFASPYQSPRFTRRMTDPMALTRHETPAGATLSRSTSTLSLTEDARLSPLSHLSRFNKSTVSLDSHASSVGLPQSLHKARLNSTRPNMVPETRISSYDSHQPPHRVSSGADPERRETMLANWRGSIRQETQTNALPQEVLEQRRADMIMDKHQARLSRLREEMSQVHREGEIDQAMRRSDMQALHRDAMRKMQARANRHV